jgi:hypothetical protein
VARGPQDDYRLEGETIGSRSLSQSRNDLLPPAVLLRLLSLHGRTSLSRTLGGAERPPSSAHFMVTWVNHS